MSSTSRPRWGRGRARAVAFLLALALAIPLSSCARLRPPPLPELTPVREARWLEQNWSNEERYWFHHASQGTATLPIPYTWFIALEQPKLQLFGDPPLLGDEGYLRRFGFIPSPHDVAGGEAESYGLKGESRALARQITSYEVRTSEATNPDGLPVGFARLENATNPVTGASEDLLGFTCAACHTGHFEYEGVSVRVDGAPAVTDLGKFRQALALSLGYTKLVPFRFGRFAERVLGPDASSEQRAELKAAFGQLVEKGRDLTALTSPVAEHDVEEGFTRLDALTRIGNQVFFQDLLVSLDPDDPGNEDALANLAPMVAPVNYPHIWSTSWFNWVQYDGSIMQPMVRNAGEALGVSARVNLTKPGPTLYDSTVAFNEIFELEALLAGPDPRSAPRGFKGLRAPHWPEDVLGAIDMEKRGRGEALYAELCTSCHNAPASSPAFWEDRRWTAPNAAGERYLVLRPMDVGTDPAQAAILGRRTLRVPAHLEIDPATLCGGAGGEVVTEAKFAAALAVVVEKTTTKWYDNNDIGVADRERMNGNRPNCVQAKEGYKARPLNGIWATAPYLHNGAVPNLYELLSPHAERSAKFHLGSRRFDPERVGYETAPISGGFELDTALPGNSNKGHEFRDEGGKGKIGRALTPEERWALVEYLKSL